MYDSLKITPKTRGYQIVFNHTNFHLYHYAGNNPIRYVDPDGRIYKNNFERIFINHVLGFDGVRAYETSIFIALPNDCRAGSFIGGFIFYEYDTYKNPVLNDKNTFVHEIYHQIQYYKNPLVQINLANEYLLNEQMSQFGNVIGFEGGESTNNYLGMTPVKAIYDGKTIRNFVYQYDKNNLSKYNSLDDLPFYESQAQFVGDYAQLYFNERFGKNGNDSDRKKLFQMSRIMSNSGYKDTEAVKWCQENLKEYQ